MGLLISEFLEIMCRCTTLRANVRPFEIKVIFDLLFLKLPYMAGHDSKIIKSVNGVSTYKSN